MKAYREAVKAAQQVKKDALKALRAADEAQNASGTQES
jgi:hypothetical protein